MRADACEISRPSGDVHVEPRILAPLLNLAALAGSVVSRDELLSAVWDTCHVTDDALTRCTSVVRRLFGDEAQLQR